jgi:hypothetical protein
LNTGDASKFGGTARASGFALKANSVRGNAADSVGHETIPALFSAMAHVAASGKTGSNVQDSAGVIR